MNGIDLDESLQRSFANVIAPDRMSLELRHSGTDETVTLQATRLRLLSQIEKSAFVQEPLRGATYFLVSARQEGGITYFLGGVLGEIFESILDTGLNIVLNARESRCAIQDLIDRVFGGHHAARNATIHH